MGWGRDWSVVLISLNMINNVISKIMSQGFENFQQSRKTKSRERTSGNQKFKFEDLNDKFGFKLIPCKLLTTSSFSLSQTYNLIFPHSVNKSEKGFI
jgi:hypothetical protein